MCISYYSYSLIVFMYLVSDEKELPEFSFYEMKEAVPNPYQGTTMDRPGRMVYVCMCMCVYIYIHIYRYRYRYRYRYIYIYIYICVYTEKRKQGEQAGENEIPLHSPPRTRDTGKNSPQSRMQGVCSEFSH